MKREVLIDDVDATMWAGSLDRFDSEMHTTDRWSYELVHYTGHKTLTLHINRCDKAIASFTIGKVFCKELSNFFKKYERRRTKIRQVTLERQNKSRAQ